MTLEQVLSLVRQLPRDDRFALLEELRANERPALFDGVATHIFEVKAGTCREIRSRRKEFAVL